MFSYIKGLSRVFMLLTLGIPVLAQEDCPPEGPLVFTQKATCLERIPSGGGESGGGTVRRPCTSYFRTEEMEQGQSAFSRSGRATFGIDEHVRSGNPTSAEINPAMTADEYGNLWLVFEDHHVSPWRLTLYRSNDGGENWQFLGYITNPDADLKEPSIAAGGGGHGMLLVAYIVDDGVKMPVPEVAAAPLRTSAFTFHSVPVWKWEGYAKPVIWTDSWETWWHAHLTCEGIYDSAAGNINVCAWRSGNNEGTNWGDEAVVFGDFDEHAWREPDGSIGTTKHRLFITCFNYDKSTLFCARSEDFTGDWLSPTSVYIFPEMPNHDVDPEVEAAIDHDNVLICCTKSYNGNDNIGTTWSTDGGDSWTYLYSLQGYTAQDEFAPALNRNEGGASWHLAYTSSSRCYYSAAPQDYSASFQLTPDQVDDNNTVSGVHTKKGIVSSWNSDSVGITWSDYRDGSPDYDTYFDRVDDPLRVHVPEEHASIQAAIDASSTGQSIHVNKGTYNENIVFNGKGVHLQSVFGTGLTVIDGQRLDSVVTFEDGESQSSAIEGFTIRNGYSSGGGGIYCYNSSPWIKGNVIRDNEAWNYGGGVQCNVSGSPWISGNWIVDNVTTNIAGGGVYVRMADPSIYNNIIAGNSSEGWGGGIHCWDSEASISNNTVTGNNALWSGGALYVKGPDAPTARNNIFWGNNATTYPGIDVDSATPTVIYTNVEGGYPGTGCIDADPLFASDYRLSRYSPCINMGTFYYTPSFDIAWQHRPNHALKDMGAYEFMGDHSLSADVYGIPESEHSVVNLTLDAGAVNAGRPYMIFGGVTERAPGVALPLGGPVLPVNFDFFTDLVMELMNSAVFANFFGNLDSLGTASAKIDTLSPLPPGSASAELFFAYACPYKIPDGWFASNPIRIRVYP